MPFTVITGPTRSYEQTRLDGSVFVVPSFQDSLNAALNDLEQCGMVEIQVDCKPSLDCTQHAAYISYQLPSLATPTLAKPRPLTIQQTADHLGVSRWFVSERIRLGQIKVIPLGKRKMIPFEEYTRLATPR